MYRFLRKIKQVGMEFNKNWTIEDNRKLKYLIKEGKTPFEIIDIIGYDKLRNHPDKKYVGQFNKFILNEIYFKPKNTEFNIKRQFSNYYKGELNYVSTFKTDSEQEYVVDFVIVKENDGQFKDSNIFNLSFTTLEIELTKRLIFVIKETIKIIKLNYDNIVILIGETENLKKINFYRNVIKDSLDNVYEIIDKSSFTNELKGYYYIIKNN